MVEDLCFHITDLVQNSVAAGAKTIEIKVKQSAGNRWLTIEVVDDGRGMDSEALERSHEPFYTGKTFKKIGLGLPLLKATAQICRGEFHITSEPGKGTKVEAKLDGHDIDCPPLGDLNTTVLGLMVSLEEIDLQFRFENSRGVFSISSAEIREETGGLHLSHPEVYAFLRDYFQTQLKPLFTSDE